jgi:O-antigen/teichoic acid export membrane protein
MGVIIRQSIKGTIVNYIGVAVGFITTFFVATRFLTTEEIGLTKVLIDASMLLAGLAQLGTNASVLRFYPYFKDDRNKDHGFFFWSLVVPLIGFFIYGLLYVILNVPASNLFAEKSPLFVNYYYFVLPMGFFMLYMAVFETNSIVLLRIVVPKLIREVGVRVLTLVVYLLYAFDILSIDGFVIAFCSVYGIAAILNIFYLFSLKRVSLKPDFKFLTKALKKDYLLYTLFLITAALGSAIMPGINTFFISAKMGLAFTGVYTIASYITAMIDIPYRSLNAISQPHISQSVKNNDIAEVNKISKNVSLHQLLAGSFIYLIIWINIDLFFKILPNGGNYLAGKQIVLILGMIGVLHSSVNVGITILTYSRYYYYSLIFTFLISAVAIFLNILFIPLWGMIGAATASLCATVLNYILLLSLNWLKMKTSPFSFGQLKVLFIVISLFVLNWFWTVIITPLIGRIFGSDLVHISVDSALRTFILISAGVITVYYWKVSIEVNSLIRKYLSKLLK